MKWYTITEHIDIETGEVLKEHEIYEKNLRKIEQELTYKIINDEQGYRYIRKFYKKNEQTKIEFN